ncbi:hypothetical protein ACVXZZ_12130 [Staphylococcus aureus]
MRTRNEGYLHFPNTSCWNGSFIENVNYLNDFEPQVEINYIYFVCYHFGGSQLEKLIYGKVNHEFESLDLSSEVEKGESIKTAIRDAIITCSNSW